MTDALAAFSTLFKIGDGATPTEAFATVAEVSKVSGPELELETTDATSFDSGGWEEMIGTILKGGKVSLELNFLPDHATHSYASGLIDDMVNRVRRNFQLVFPDSGGTTWLLPALVVKFSPDLDVKGKLKASVDLQVTGQPTLA